MTLRHLGLLALFLSAACGGNALGDGASGDESAGGGDSSGGGGAGGAEAGADGGGVPDTPACQAYCQALSDLACDSSYDDCVTSCSETTNYVGRCASVYDALVRCDEQEIADAATCPVGAVVCDAEISALDACVYPAASCDEGTSCYIGQLASNGAYVTCITTSCGSVAYQSDCGSIQEPRAVAVVLQSA